MAVIKKEEKKEDYKINADKKFTEEFLYQGSPKLKYNWEKRSNKPTI